MKLYLFWCNVLWSTGSDFCGTDKFSTAGCLSKCCCQCASPLLIRNFEHSRDQVISSIALPVKSPSVNSHNTMTFSCHSNVASHWKKRSSIFLLYLLFSDDSNLTNFVNIRRLLENDKWIKCVWRRLYYI